jgi:hypothetical protein
MNLPRKEDLSPVELAVLQQLVEGPCVHSMSEQSDWPDLSPTEVQAALERFEALGIVRRSSPVA